MAIPTLAMIPSGYKANKIYSVLPTDGTGDFATTRASSATRINKDGYIETVDSGIPRLDYPLIDGVVNGCPSLLLEGQSTNLITYSEDFTQSSWPKVMVDVSNNTELSPSGTLTATRIIINAVGTDLRTQCNVIASSNYTFSFYAKKGTSTGITYRVYDVSNGSNIVSPTDYYSQLSTDWERVNLNFTTPSGCTSVFVYLTSNSVEIGDIYLWGAQLEEQSYATSYIPTNGAIATRLADVCSLDVSGLGLSEITEHFSDGTSNVITSIPSTYTVSTNTITKIIAE